MLKRTILAGTALCALFLGGTGIANADGHFRSDDNFRAQTHMDYRPNLPSHRFEASPRYRAYEPHARYRTEMRHRYQQRFSERGYAPRERFWHRHHRAWRAYVQPHRWW